jgi:hypothetical protein
VSARAPWNPEMEGSYSVPPFMRTSYPHLGVVLRIGRECCQAHDRAYYEGTDGDEAGRLIADTALYAGLQRLRAAGAMDPETGAELDQRSIEDLFWAVHHFGAAHWGTGRAWDGRVLGERQRIESS